MHSTTGCLSSAGCTLMSSCMPWQLRPPAHATDRGLECIHCGGMHGTQHRPRKSCYVTLHACDVLPCNGRMSRQAMLAMIVRQLALPSCYEGGAAVWYGVAWRAHQRSKSSSHPSMHHSHTTSENMATCRLRHVRMSSSSMSNTCRHGHAAQQHRGGEPRGHLCAHPS